MEEEFFLIGVDVGTASVRAALVNHHGRLISSRTKSISIENPAPDFFEQSSEEIWTACCECVKSVLATSGVHASKVKGLGFDATCSLVVLDEGLAPLPVSEGSKPGFNIVMWMDHRAVEQTQRINKTHHSVLKYVGGSISPEMQTPKLLWLKEHMPDTWTRAKHFFDLPDFLTFRATGQTTRSLCSLVCKWTYVCTPQKNGWDESFFQSVGLHDMVNDKFIRMGTDVLPPGTKHGELSSHTALELGLVPGTIVAVSMIDAHAGGIGVLPTILPGEDNFEMTHRMGVIAGSSCCHMATSNNEIFVPGVWGPYYSAMMSSTWLSEGGQSAAGKLLDFVVANYSDVLDVRSPRIFDELNELVYKYRDEAQLTHACFMTQSFHVLPYIHGNRAPFADPTLTGTVSGLRFGVDRRHLAVTHYYASVQALCLETYQIISEMNKAGHQISKLCVCGGLAKNELFLETLADCTRCVVVLPDELESVLLGSAMLAASAYTLKPLQEVMKTMGGHGKAICPNASVERFYCRKFSVMKEMHESQIRCRELMSADGD